MISSAYQYYITTYGHQKVSRFDTHKKSELRKVYNNIVKLNKKSPLYKVKLTDDVQRFAIDIKEGSRILENAILESTDSENNGFEQKVAYSSDESVLNTTYIGNHYESEPEGIAHRIEVKQVATSQINTGDFISSNRLDLAPGHYSFDLTIGDTAYEFQFKVAEGSTNLQLQEKLMKLINNSNVGICAEVLKDGNGSSALQIQAKQTGIHEYRKVAFQISDEDSSKQSGSVAFLGLNNISSPGQNAIISIDGKEMTSPSNMITLNRNYAITVKHVSAQGESIEIGMKHSLEAMFKNIKNLAGSFNSLYDLAKKQEEREDTNHKLLQDLNYITKRYRHVLDSSGLTVQENGYLKPDEALVTQAVEDGSLENNKEEFKSFRNTLLRRIHMISLNPMEYVKKTMISYPNPIKGNSNPYQTSIYTGMIFNGYI